MRSSMRIEGQFIAWDEKRHFGFIQPAHGGKDILVSDGSFDNKAARPSLNDKVSFEVELSSKGRERARRVRPLSDTDTKPQATAAHSPTEAAAEASPSATPHHHRRHPTASASSWDVPTLFAIPLFLAFFLFISAVWKIPKISLLWPLMMSIATFIAYAKDKRAAHSPEGEEEDRIPETTLHGLALLGGWPGALLAQQMLKHKNDQRVFRLMFWLSVVGNSVLCVVLSMSYAAWFLRKAVAETCTSLPC
ncbi:DUF1294 domain-containing protein [Leptothrix ochracea]|uniref:DUF1294 domain-containing protein n=2 Tax=Leptothrix ochracea TaxID=735331 RepID=UPI0034E1F166